FTAAMAPVLAVTGVLLYSRFGHDLDRTINSGLRSRAADVTELVRSSDGDLDLRRLPSKSAEGFAEILDEQGRVAGATPTLQGRTLLSAAERAAALRGERFIERPADTAMREPSRLLARPLSVSGHRLIVVVGASTTTRIDSLGDLLGVLVVGGPVALLLAALAAYGGAAAALRPVEAMRARAAEISAAEPQERLPVPRADDEIGRLGVTLNAMLGRLGDALARERLFVADASHELRTPLAILKAELELALTKDPGRAPRTREQLEAALLSAAEETDRLTQLAEDLLTLAQSDEGSLPVEQSEVEIASVLESVARRFERRSSEDRRPIEVRCEEGLLAEVDPMRLDQAIGNLVDNSLRYGAGTIELSAKRAEGVLQIHVSDRGPGLPPDFLGHAFERFTRVEHSSATGGAGLGLSITASIAAAHGGRARLANRRGGGADAWLELPVPSYLETPV
ncbi:MAG: sensor histidine kinase, partial [Solirubrobacteraceae bacterium]